MIKIPLRTSLFNLETPVGREKDMQDIGAHGESEKPVVTLLVMRGFSGFPGGPRACVDFCDPTEASRFNNCAPSSSFGDVVILCHRSRITPQLGLRQNLWSLRSSLEISS